MNDKTDPSRFRQDGRSTGGEVDYRAELGSFFASAAGNNVEKLENFPCYVPRQSIARFLCLTELFKMALHVQGDIMECGVNWGGGLMTFAQLSATLEPVNLQRRIVGFDTFSGFAGISEQDQHEVVQTAERRPHGYQADSYADLQRAISLYDANRFIGHIQKVELIKGDVAHSVPAYLEREPQTVVSLLHLDLDLYEPTRVCLRHFLPRMPKGSVIVFDELNNRTWPGETLAVMEELGLNRLRIQRFTYEPHVSYAILE
ncbi:MULTISPECIES: TylF/MycF/NovP-related O-methyltransferase [Achromobacter]|uniref:Class I SAM-dependent methyltransferase n=1 Tax=Achromobacter denitrificans TaxID=32002 RepID=A0A6N0JLP1_ACHDE|nr:MULTISPECIES: TylF/MycF/NovP-related O-methyltransferase [Achromobacter]MDF3857212.1 TylF/MycF/NovP-related O-methyltransferase [Achromobacter denitrificans]QKQ47983.1 class I SAM-dependent methyltransferase [Achromobacter denitrificans]